MPVNVSHDAWYRPLYDTVHSGLLSLGYTHDYEPGPAKAVRAFDGASDVPLERYHQDLSNGLSLIVKVRGVLKFGSLLFGLSHTLKHPTLTRILREYSRAGEKYPGMSIGLGLLMSGNRRPDPVVSKALRSWIEKASSRERLIEIGNFWIGEERDFILPYVSQIKEEEFLSAALSPRLHPAYSLAVLLYLGKFEEAREQAFRAHEHYLRFKPLSDLSRNEKFLLEVDDEFLETVLESCRQRQLLLTNADSSPDKE